MMPRRASAPNLPKARPVRMAALYVPNGMHEPTWTPKAKGAGSEWELSEGLLPLTHFKPHLNVFTNLWNQGSKSGDGHYVKLSGWLTSTTISKTLGVDISCNGVSMDHRRARRGQGQPFPSLNSPSRPSPPAWTATSATRAFTPAHRLADRRNRWPARSIRDRSSSACSAPLAARA
jgi:hypothetical protein